MGLTQANNKFREALRFLGVGDNVNAQIKLEESIQLYDSLKEYSSLETAYEYLASTYINIGATADYEAKNQAKLLFSSNNAKLQGHLALAGLYKVLEERNSLLLPSVSADDLSAYKSFHYSEAYKITQGNLDNDAHTVLQREIGVAHNAKLGTFNIQQCVAVIAHDPSTHKVVLSHFDRYSGPLKFIDQILNEFPAGSKIDLYLTGGRDRVTTVSPTSTTKISDNNINQVLKQIYAHKERFTIKASDLGDKASPEAVVFNTNSAQLEHRMPNHGDISLNSRAAMMNIQLNNQMLQKGDYLHPLNRVDFSQAEANRKKLFSPEQLQTMKDQYQNYDTFYSNRPGFSEAWKHNQVFQPLMAAIKEISTPGNPYDFEQGLFKDFARNDVSSLVQLPFDVDMSFLQHGMQQFPDLINEIAIQNSQHSQACLHADVLDGNGDDFDNIDTEQGMDIDDIDMEPFNKRICLSNRRRREAEVCSFSWDDIDKINSEKEKPRDIERINVDSAALLEHLKGADEVTRKQLLQFAATCQITGNRQSTVRALIHMERFKPHLQKASKISFGLTQGLFAEDAFADLFKGDPKTAINLAGLMSVSHGLGKLADWITKNPVNKLLKLSTPFMRRGTSILNGFDLIKQVSALKSGNKDAVAGIVGDSINIGIDLAEAGIEIAEISSETMALLSVSSVTGPVGEVVGAIVMLSVKIFNAVRSVAQLDHIVHLSDGEKFKEGWRAFLGMSREEYIQKIVDLTQEYERILLEKLELFKNHPEIKHIIFPAIKEITQKCRVIIKATRTCSGGGPAFPPTCTNKETVCEPVFSPIQDSHVNFDTKRNDFKLVREKPTSPTGSRLVCLPTGDYTRVTVPTYRCDAAIGITNANNTGNVTFFDLGLGSDSAVGFPNLTNFFMVNDGYKKYTGGKEADLFFIQGSKIEGDLDGGEEIDTLDISGFQSTQGSLEIRLGNYMAYGNSSLGLKNIENLIDEGRSGAKSIFVVCNTTNLKLQGGTLKAHDNIFISQNDHCSYETTLTLQAHTDVFNQAKKGSFRYNIQPKKGEVAVHFSVHAPAFPELSAHQFVFDISISELASLQHTTTNIAGPRRHHVKFHFLNHEIRQFLRNIQTVFIRKTDETNEAEIHYQLRKPAQDTSIASCLPTALNQTQSEEVLENHFKNKDWDHFNITLSNRREIRHFTLKLMENCNAVEIDNFKLNVKYFLTVNTLFHFKNGEQLKIGDKNIYLFHYIEEDIESIINTYLPIASRLKLTCIIHTLRNEVVIIGHDKHEVMQNDPNASVTHLLGNGGENIFVIDSGVTELPSMPLSSVNLYHLEGGNHMDTLDLRALSTQIYAKLKITPKIMFVPPNEQNGLGNDLLLLLVIKSKSAKTITEFMSIRLKNGINWYHKLHVVLDVPQKIVGSISNLHLKPIPLEFDKQHEIISIGAKDIAKNTEIWIPKTYQHVFFRDGNHLRLTNALSYSQKIKPNTILFENYYSKPKLATLSIKFSNNETIVLADKSAEINAAPNFEEKWTIRQKALADIAFNQSNRAHENENKLSIGVLASSNHSTIHSAYEHETHANSIEDNGVIFRRSRSVEQPAVEPIASSGATRDSGILQMGWRLMHTMAHSMTQLFRKDQIVVHDSFEVKGSLNVNGVHFFKNPSVFPELNHQQDTSRLHSMPIDYRGTCHGNAYLGRWILSLLSRSAAKRMQKLDQVSQPIVMTDSDWAYKHLQDGIKKYTQKGN